MSTNHCKINMGLESYQEKKREESLQIVTEALEDMRRAGQNINYSTLSRESGVSRQTLHATHMQEYLMQQPEFNASLPQPIAPQGECSPEAFEIQRIEILRLKHQIVTLAEKNERLQEQLRQEKDKRKSEKFSLMEKRGLFVINQNHNRIT